MMLTVWAQQWNIPQKALEELRILFGIEDLPPPKLRHLSSEAAIINLVKTEASSKGARLWRNNVGATYTQRGDFIRYGLANENARINNTIKSADLIGIKPIVITQPMVGHTFGHFISREVKRKDWRYSGNDREKAQLKWIELITSLGGDACFTCGEGTF